MDIEEDLKILQEFTELDRKLRNYKVESDYDNFCERRCVAIDHILAEREEDKKKIAELKEYIFIAPNLDEMTAAKYISIRRDAYIRGRADEQQKAEEIINNNYVSKQKVKEELEEAEKENEPYEQHNKESRIYWINKGKISLAKKILEDK